MFPSSRQATHHHQLSQFSRFTHSHNTCARELYFNVREKLIEERATLIAAREEDVAVREADIAAREAEIIQMRTVIKQQSADLQQYAQEINILRDLVRITKGSLAAVKKQQEEEFAEIHVGIDLLEATIHNDTDTLNNIMHHNGARGQNVDNLG